MLKINILSGLLRLKKDPEADKDPVVIPQFSKGICRRRS